MWAYLPTLTGDKAVVNNCLVREANWKLACVAKRHGGSQCLWLPDGTKVSLEYDANKYKLFVMCRHPTAHELRTIPIDWEDYHIEDLKIDDGTKPAQRKNCTLETPIVDPASVVEEPEMESTWITQEDAKAKKMRLHHWQAMWLLITKKIQRRRQLKLRKSLVPTTISTGN
eukprot:10301730-Ditylum_brightwellii.AAC.1